MLKIKKLNKIFIHLQCKLYILSTTQEKLVKWKADRGLVSNAFAEQLLLY